MTRRNQSHLKRCTGPINVSPASLQRRSAALPNNSDVNLPKLRLLPSARKKPLVVSREDSLRHAETQMLLNEYSQLPVMTGDRTVHGLISWKSIGKAYVLGTAGRAVSDYMDTEVRVLPDDMPLLKAVDEIIRHEIVLVRDRVKHIVGIVTTTDLSIQLRDLTSAFLLVGNIERQLRRLIDTHFEVDVLRSFVAPGSSRIVNGVEDLSFGEYLRLLQTPEHWSKLGLKIEPNVVLKRLEQVRAVRNAVMHFRSENDAALDLQSLRSTEAFLVSLRPRDGRGQ
jgi:predicted transcriptional regulator